MSFTQGVTHVSWINIEWHLRFDIIIYMVGADALKQRLMVPEGVLLL